MRKYITLKNKRYLMIEGMPKEAKQTEYITQRNEVGGNELVNNFDKKNDCQLTPVITGELLSLKKIIQDVYLCQVLSYFFGITAIVGLIINYMKRNEARGTWLESHIIWQIRTFWIATWVPIVGFAFMFFFSGFLMAFIGILLFVAGTSLIIYRAFNGWFLLCENRPIEHYNALIMYH